MATSPRHNGIEFSPREGGQFGLEAEIATQHARAQIVHYHFARAPCGKLRTNGNFRLELCLTRNHSSARINFPDHWNADRFESIGDLFMIPANFDAIGRSEDTRPLTSVVIDLPPHPIRELHPNIPSLMDWHLTAGLNLKVAPIRNLMLRVASELKHQSYASELMIDALSMELTIEIVRTGKALRESNGTGGLSPRQLRTIDDRLREIGRTPSLEELAQLCGISTRQLARGFRASRGCSIGMFVIANQIEHAKQLLSTDHKIEQVAALLGYSDASNFSFAFRRETGLAPGEFRKTILGNHHPRNDIGQRAIAHA